MAGTYTKRASPNPSSECETKTEPSADAFLPTIVVVQDRAVWTEQARKKIQINPANNFFMGISPLHGIMKGILFRIPGTARAGTGIIPFMSQTALLARAIFFLSIE